MKILQIATRDNGGAGKSALRLHIGLKSLGIDAKILTLERHSQDKDVIQFKEDRSIFRKIFDRINKEIISLDRRVYQSSHFDSYDVFSDCKATFDISKHLLVKEADIITLRWIAFMVDYKKFFNYIKGKPIVFRLSDMNPFTGGCHYSNGCNKYKTGCGCCPQLRSNVPDDLSRKIFKIKEKAYRNQNIYIVAISRQHAEQAKGSYLFRDRPIEIIPNGIPDDIYKIKHETKFLKELLGIPQGKTAILYAADYKAKRKGFEYLLEALALLKQRVDLSQITLVTLGSTQVVESIAKDLSVCQLGYIADEELLSNVYSSCDFLVMPSIEEAGGQVFLEAMACGLPVIAFNVGSMRDVIMPDRNGFLVEQKNVEELADKIEYMITYPKKRQEMGENARKLIEKEYNLQSQAKRYIELYKRILNCVSIFLFLSFLFLSPGFAQEVSESSSEGLVRNSEIEKSWVVRNSKAY